MALLLHQVNRLKFMAWLKSPILRTHLLILQLLEFTPPGAGGEVQLTDAIATLMNLEQVDAYYMKGKSHDCGSKLGYMKANVEYALGHKEMGPEYKAYLKSLSL
jgi:UTP--glucose-1-phosphate uridylyltransferase